MQRLTTILLLASLLGSPAAAEGFGVHSAPGGTAAAAAPCPPWSASPSPSRRLAAFAERRRLEARVRMADMARDAERRSSEARLRRSGSPDELSRYRARLEREDALDALRLRAELPRPGLPRAAGDVQRWWVSLGPATRRAFLRSGLELHRVQREGDREARLRLLERDIESRPADPAETLFGAPDAP